MEGGGRVAGFGRQDVLGVDGQGHVGHPLSREDPGIGRTHAVSVDDGRDVDQVDIAHPMGARIGHRAGDGAVEGVEDDLRVGVGARGVQFDPGADEVGAEAGRARVVGRSPTGGGIGW